MRSIALLSLFGSFAALPSLGVIVPSQNEVVISYTDTESGITATMFKKDGTYSVSRATDVTDSGVIWVSVENPFSPNNGGQIFNNFKQRCESQKEKESDQTK